MPTKLSKMPSRRNSARRQHCQLNKIALSPLLSLPLLLLLLVLFSSVFAFSSRIKTTSSNCSPTKLFLWFNQQKNVNPNDPNNNNNNKSSFLLDQELQQMDKQIRANAQSQLDVNAVVQAVERQRQGQMIDSNNSTATVETTETTTTPPPSSWQIALAAAMTVSTAASWAGGVQDPILLTILFTVTFALARADPLQDDSLLGALARLLGRSTYTQYQQAVEPKLATLARAVVTGQDEILQLTLQVQELQAQNDDLQQWKDTRLQAEYLQNKYTKQELQQKASACNNLPRGYSTMTKFQLLIALLEAGVEFSDEKKE